MAIFEQTSVLDSSGNTINPSQNESIILLRKICGLLESAQTTDSKMRQKVCLEQISNVAGTTTGVVGYACIGVNIMSSGSGGQVAPLQGTGLFQPTWEGPVDPRWGHMDSARNTYAKAIRRKLVWS